MRAFTLFQPEVCRLDTVRLNYEPETGSIGYIARCYRWDEASQTSAFADGMSIAKVLVTEEVRNGLSIQKDFEPYRL